MTTADEVLARRLRAETAYQKACDVGSPGPALVFSAHAVLLSTDLPAYRRKLAECIASFDPIKLSRPRAAAALNRTGVLPALALVLAHGGSAAVIAEPFSSAWVLGSSPLRAALVGAQTAPPAALDGALRARPLHRGAPSSILCALLTGVLIQDPDLLLHLEDLRENVARAAADAQGEFSDPAMRLLETIAAQVWIQDGTLIRQPEPATLTRLASAAPPPAMLDVLRRLFFSPTIGPSD